MMTRPSEIPVFILAGGLGTRLSEETHLKPKPMIEIGDSPILLHIMRWYYSFGFNDFIICAGYRASEIKQYFMTYEAQSNHLMIDHRRNDTAPPVVFGPDRYHENWRVRVIDTGVECMTGGRVGKALMVVQEHARQLQEPPFEHFALTYGDGLSDVHLKRELDFHLEHQKIGTLLGVPPTSRFGELELRESDQVHGFREKPKTEGVYINGGFFFFRREFENYLSVSEALVLEQSPLSSLANDGHLVSYKHTGFWHPMDTLRDRNHLQSLWNSGNAPWAVDSSRRLSRTVGPAAGAVAAQPFSATL